MTDEATRYFRDLYDHLIRLADHGRQLPGPALERDGHPPLHGVEPPQRGHEAADHHRHHLPAAQLPHRLLRAELRLPGAGVARADVELLRARASGSSWRRRSSSSWSSAGAAGSAARPSERRPEARSCGVRSATAGPSRVGQPLGRSAVCTSYSVHQASQPSGTGKPSCLRRSTRSRTVSFCSRTSASVPASAGPVAPGGPQRLLQAPGLAAGLDDGVGAVRHVGPECRRRPRPGRRRPAASRSPC